MALQRDPVTFGRLKALSMRKRMEIAQAPDIAMGLLSSLTPTDLALLFPTYYKKILPDVSGFRAAISRQTAEQQAAAQGNLLERLSAVEKTTSSASISRPWMERVKEKLGLASAPSPAKLSTDQVAAWNKLKQGPIGVSSSEGKIFGKLSTSQLASIGVTRTKDNTGADVYQYQAPEVGREEAVSRLKIESDVGARSGGSRSWRNRNPGNIEYGDFAKSQGAIGSDGRFAVFRTEQDGVNAQRQLLFNGKNYKDLTLAQAINRWAPSTENNVPAYIAAMGANPNTKMSEFTREQQDILLSNMRKHEGWKPGASTGKEGEGSSFTEEQVTATQQRLKKEKEEARLGQYAALVANNMPESAGLSPTPGGESVTGGAKSKVAAVQYMMSIVGKSEHDPDQRELIRKFLETGGHGVNPEQTAWCAATVGSALRQAGIKDIPADKGGNVATSYGSWGRGVNISQENVRAGDVGVFMNHRSTGETLAPGQVGGHVGMLTGNSRVRADGKLEVEMVEGNTDNKGSIKWHVVGERGLQIRRARPGVEYEEETLTQVADQAKVEPRIETRPGEAPEAPPPAPPEPTADVYKKTELNPQAVRDIQAQEGRMPPGPASPGAPTPKQEAPRVTSGSYQLNMKAFREAVKNDPSNTYPGWMIDMASDQDIIDGFNKDARVKAAGVNIADGKLSVKDMSNPEVKAVIEGAQKSGALKAIEQAKPKVEAPKEAPKPVPEPPKPTATVEQRTSRPGEAPEPTPPPPPEQAPKPVKGYSDGGSFNAPDSLNFYKVDKQDDIVAINPQTQKPIATMQSGETLSRGDGRVDVTPQSKSNDAGPVPDTNVTQLSNIMSSFSDALSNIGKNTQTIPKVSQETVTNHPNLIGDTNRQIVNQQKFSPSYDRAMHRISRGTEPSGSFDHFSYGNK